MERRCSNRRRPLALGHWPTATECQQGLDPTVVSPAAISITAAPPSVHVKVEPSIRVHVLPYQRGQRGVVAWCHPSVPTGDLDRWRTLPKFRASLA